MLQSIFILGRQPALGLAELESLYGGGKLQSAGPLAALLDVDPAEVNFDRLGGSMRLGRFLTRLDTTEWPKIEQYLRKSLPSHMQYVPAGKFKLGLSAFGFDITPAKLNATALTLKKSIKNSGRSVRVVPNVQLELNSAQVKHNGLTTPTGWEILIVRDPGDSGSSGGSGSDPSRARPSTIIAQTIRVQDIDAYAARDQGRPKRDARVGMLPPKLAQIIVNCAVADADPKTGSIVLDPFCGTGVVLQEASLMGFDISGTDLDPRMVEYTDKNLTWLLNQRVSHVSRPPEQANNPHWRYYSLEQGDATTHAWKPQPNFVASESYLGRPFTETPSAETLSRTVSDCNLIVKKFLNNLFPQLQPGARLCIAVPAWQTKPGQFKQLPLVDGIAELGYNRISFEHVRDEELRYYRADQIVARQLLVLTKKN